MCVCGRVDKGTFTADEQEHFTRMSRAFALDLVPYFNTCLQTLFPPSQLALMLGVPVSELHKMVSFPVVGMAQRYCVYSASDSALLLTLCALQITILLLLLLLLLLLTDE